MLVRARRDEAKCGKLIKLRNNYTTPNIAIVRNVLYVYSGIFNRKKCVSHCRYSQTTSYECVWVVAINKTITLKTRCDRVRTYILKACRSFCILIHRITVLSLVYRLRSTKVETKAMINKLRIVPQVGMKV